MGNPPGLSAWRIGARVTDPHGEGGSGSLGQVGGARRGGERRQERARRVPYRSGVPQQQLEAGDRGRRGKSRWRRSSVDGGGSNPRAVQWRKVTGKRVGEADAAEEERERAAGSKKRGGKGGLGVRVTRNGPRASRGPVTARSNPGRRASRRGRGPGYWPGRGSGKRPRSAAAGPRPVTGRPAGGEETGEGKERRGKELTRGANSPAREKREESGAEQGNGPACGRTGPREEVGRARSTRGKRGGRRGLRGEGSWAAVAHAGGERGGPRGKGERGGKEWAGPRGGFGCLSFILSPLLLFFLYSANSNKSN
jgi:hypothetical protein